MVPETQKFDASVPSPLTRITARLSKTHAAVSREARRHAAKFELQELGMPVQRLVQ